MSPRTSKTAPNRRSRKRSFGSLALIGALLIASAGLRLASEAGTAIAAVPLGADADETSETQCAPAEGFEPLLEALKLREARLEGREAEITRRLQAVRLSETQIDARLSELQDAEAALRDTIALASSAAENDLTRLTDVYANMKPKQAAALFEEMDPDFAAGFLGRMRPDAAAAIMAGLSPQAAYTISVVLAGRNASVPRE